MASWVVTIRPEHPEHWGYAAESEFWDIVTRRDIKAGDDVFFWQGEGSFVSWTRATCDALDIVGDMPAASWNDRKYVCRIPFDIVSEQPREAIRWSEFAKAAGITQLPSNGQLRVPESAEQYVRDLFSPVVDRPNDDPYAPDDYPDTREKITTAIYRRRGQQRFRDQLIDAYDGTCAVTGSTVEETLEAAHIRPYRGVHSHRVTNGLLLRADVHTLFDLFLLTVDETSTVRVGPDLADTEYSRYDGAKALLPSLRSDRPKKQDLRSHHAQCSWFSPTS